MKVFPLQLKSKGFTLVETLVSTFIISMVILGPLTLASNASLYARITKDTMTATYLGQEAVELLRHQQDSIYIRCVQESGSFCVPQGSESISDAAWRIFQNRFNSMSGVSCFSDENANGCAFDFLDMTNDENSTPTKYVSTSSSCNTLSIEQATNLYVCTGAHGSGSGYITTNFSRSISITSVPNFGNGTAEQNYFNDLRVVVTVTFRRPSGLSRSIQIVDFLHARS